MNIEMQKINPYVNPLLIGNNNNQNFINESQKRLTFLKLISNPNIFKSEN